jgi:sugar lactone lactonase YvrE
MKKRSSLVLAAMLLCHAASQASAADTWYITTVAGTGKPGYSGDGGPATQAMLTIGNWNLLVDASGCLYIADGGNNRIRKVDASGIITTIAGNGTAGFSGDGGPATEASLNNPASVTFDKAGNLYIGDIYNHRVRKVDPSGIITTFAGNGKQGFPRDGELVTEASLNYPMTHLDAQGTLYISCWQAVYRVDLPSGAMTRIAGTGEPGDSGDGGPATAAKLEYKDMCFDPQGNLYIVHNYARVRKVDTKGIITTVVGGGLGDVGGPALKAYLSPLGVAIDRDGNLWIADNRSHRIMMVDAAGIIRTVAGTGARGYSGDGGPALEAKLDEPGYIRIGPDGSVYFLEKGNHVVRKLYRR